MDAAPQIDPDFRAYAEERGWSCFTEYVPPMEDVDEDGEMMGGFWTTGIVHEELIGEEMHVFVMDLGNSNTFVYSEDGRRVLIELAEAGWRDYLGKLPA